MDIQIPDFSKARVLVVGDLMLDRYWQGDAKRISPEAPVPVMQVNQIEERPGGAGNVALNLASLGAQVTLIGLVGHDAEAETLEHYFKKNAIHCHLEKIESWPTITKLRVISQHQQLIRLDFEKLFQPSHVELIMPKVTAELRNVDVMILSDYGKGTLKNPQMFIHLARKAKVPVFIDPKSLDFSVYQGATLLTPNLKEFEAVVGECADDETITERAHTLIKKHQLEFLLVTRGADGISNSNQQ